MKLKLSLLFIFLLHSCKNSEISNKANSEGFSRSKSFSIFKMPIFNAVAYAQNQSIDLSNIKTDCIERKVLVELNRIDALNGIIGGPTVFILDSIIKKNKKELTEKQKKSLEDVKGKGWARSIEAWTNSNECLPGTLSFIDSLDVLCCSIVPKSN